MHINIRKHLWYYVFMVIMQALGMLLILLTAYDKRLQMTIITVSSAFYILWAILHQYVHHSLTTKIVLEYVLVGTLGVTLSLFLFNA